MIHWQWHEKIFEIVSKYLWMYTKRKKRYAIEQSFLLSSYWQIPLLETDAKCRFATGTSICDVSIIMGTAKLPINLTLEQY